MKTYVAMGGWDYEGYTDPYYVGPDMELAKESFRYSGNDYRTIFVWEDGKFMEKIEL